MSESKNSARSDITRGFSVVNSEAEEGAVFPRRKAEREDMAKRVRVARWEEKKKGKGEKRREDEGNREEKRWKRKREGKGRVRTQKRKRLRRKG